MILTLVKTLATSFAGSPSIWNCLMVSFSDSTCLARKLHRCCVSFLLAFHQQTRGRLAPLTVTLNNFGHLLGHLIEIAFSLRNYRRTCEDPLGRLTKCESSTLFPLILNLFYSWPYYENKNPHNWGLFSHKWWHWVDHKFRAEVKANARFPEALKIICTDRRAWRKHNWEYVMFFSIFPSHFTMNVYYF